MSVLKDLMVKFLDDVLFPAVDIAVSQLKLPFQIDDKIWEFAKSKITELLAAVPVEENKFGVSIGGITAFNLKDALKNFIVNDVFPVIDNVTRNWHTPFELDNIAWSLVKGEIQKALDKLEIPMG